MVLGPRGPFGGEKGRPRGGIDGEHPDACMAELYGPGRAQVSASVAKGARGSSLYALWHGPSRPSASDVFRLLRQRPPSVPEDLRGARIGTRLARGPSARFLWRRGSKGVIALGTSRPAPGRGRLLLVSAKVGGQDRLRPIVSFRLLSPDLPLLLCLNSRSPSR